VSSSSELRFFLFILAVLTCVLIITFRRGFVPPPGSAQNGIDESIHDGIRIARAGAVFAWLLCFAKILWLLATGE
jgi:hypothetical protein